jgi:hypothetical protein
MPISFPLALPASPAIRRVAFGGRAVVGVSASPFTLSQQVFAHAGQAWQASVSLPAMHRDEAGAWQAFFLSLNGREGTFLMGDQAAATARGDATGTPLVAGASQTGNSLDTDGWTNSITGILLAGDYFQLGSGSTARLHLVLNDADSDGAGAATLDIWPSLRTSPADTDPLVVASPAGLWRMDSNTPGWDLDEALFYGFDFTASEAL